MGQKSATKEKMVLFYEPLIEQNYTLCTAFFCRIEVAYKRGVPTSFGPILNHFVPFRPLLDKLLDHFWTLLSRTCCITM